MSTDTREALKEAEMQAKRTLRAVQRHRNATNGYLAQRTGMHINTVQGYTGGSVKLTLGVLAQFAKALDVPTFVLAMEENEAVRWVIDNAPNKVYGSKPNEQLALLIAA